MVNIQINIDYPQDKTVNVFKAIHNLSSKQDAVVGIIKDWENIQTLSIMEIENAVIEKIKEENKDDIRKILNRMRSCYEDYEKGMDEIIKGLCKKYKKTEKQMNEILDGESYEEGADKFMDKVWNDWITGTSKLQEELPKEYKLESISPEVIEHEESFWSINHEESYWGVEFNYNQYEEELTLSKNNKTNIKRDDFKIILNFVVKRAIEKAINILRGENSIRNIVEESKDYFNEMEERDKEVRKQFWKPKSL
jgi:hypothetical protein